MSACPECMADKASHVSSNAPQQNIFIDLHISEDKQKVRINVINEIDMLIARQLHLISACHLIHFVDPIYLPI